MKVRYKDEFGNYYGPITINESIENKYQNGPLTQFFITPDGDIIHPKRLELIDKKAEREKDGRVLSIKLLDSGYFLGDDGHIYSFHELDFDIPENEPEEPEEDEEKKEKEEEKLNPHVYIKGVEGRGKEILELLQKHGEQAREFTFENPDSYYYIIPSTRKIDYFCNKESIIGSLITTFYEEITLLERPVKRRVFEIKEGVTKCYQCPLSSFCTKIVEAMKITKCEEYDLTTLKEITNEN